MQKPEKLKICVVEASKKKLNPIIVEFQNGKLKSEAVNELECGVYSSKDKNDEHCCIAINNGSSSYMGREIDNKICQTFIGIRKRNSNELTLYPATHALLGPVIRSTSPKKKLKLHDKNASFREKLARLQDQFGSKKLARKFGNKVNIDNSAVADKIIASASQVNMSMECEQAETADFFSMLPQCNASASSSDDVYDLEDIITEKYLEQLENEASRLLDIGLDEFETSKYKYSPLFKFLFEYILSRKKIDDEEKRRRIAVLIYTEYLIALINTNATELAAKNYKPCSISSRVNKKLLNEFTFLSKNGRSRSLDLKDKGICHVIIMALILHQYKISFKLISNTFRCDAEQIVKYCDAIRATKITTDDDRFIALKLPLPEKMTTKFKIRVHSSNKRRK